MSPVTVVWLFLAVSWVCLHFVIVCFPEHTHLLLRIVHGMALTNVLLFGATIILQLTHLYARVKVNIHREIHIKPFPSPFCIWNNSQFCALVFKNTGTCTVAIYIMLTAPK